jgi:phage N-6-adenine-methyltransferase
MLIGYRSSNHPQQVRAHGTDPHVDDRATTAEVFAPLAKRFRFTIDVAASADNAKCARYYSIEDDGLRQSWAGERVWCNPPYSSIRPWIEKAWAERNAEVVVMLLPANRTEQAWWQQLVEPYRDRTGSPLTTEFLSGRLRFIAPGATRIGANERPPFGCVLLVWHHTADTANVAPDFAQGVLDFAAEAST